MVRPLITFVRSLCSEEGAATATEYAIMLSLVVVAVFAAIPTVGVSLRAAFGPACFNGELPEVVFVSRASLG